MKQRFDLTVVAASGYKAMFGVHSYVQNSGLNLGLLELVKDSRILDKRLCLLPGDARPSGAAEWCHRGPVELTGRAV